MIRLSLIVGSSVGVVESDESEQNQAHIRAVVLLSPSAALCRPKGYRVRPRTVVKDWVRGLMPRTLPIDVTYSSRLNARTMKTAICPRVTESSGQKRLGSELQPDVMPSVAKRSMNAAAKPSMGTSSKTLPVAGPGEMPKARSMNTAI